MGHKIELEVVTLRYLCYISSDKGLFFFNKLKNKIYKIKLCLQKCMRQKI